MITVLKSFTSLPLLPSTPLALLLLPPKFMTFYLIIKNNYILKIILIIIINTHIAYLPDSIYWWSYVLVFGDYLP